MSASDSSSPSQPEFAPALQTIVELVRRIMHADVASILGYSLTDKTVRWKAASGFTVNVDYSKPVSRPLGSILAWEAHDGETVSILRDIGQSPEFPAEQFPVNVAEGVCDMAIAPLRIIGNSSGALTAGYRTSHEFSEDEKHLLRDLAEMAAVVLDSERLVESVTAAEKIWEQTFNAIGEGILVHNASGTILHCNARAAEMMESETSQIIGRNLEEAFARMFGKRAADYYLADNHGASAMIEVQTDTGQRYLVSIFP
ncbi:MAG TPA: GAF domain-containing protein, partial [Pyrinomonadaceae bacterium]|nr:GAF domain-containing protein [Pyrinomonadaceae bacterium]